MKTSTANVTAGRDDQPAISLVDGWTLREYREVGSTNLVAAGLPAWQAVRSDTQTAGRGRFQRQWVSDAGGLWLSAVLPTDGGSVAWHALPLAVGWAVCHALRNLGVKNLRMRWPNDVLVNERKLAGLLIDQFSPNVAVAGIGINVSNHPEARDVSLRHATARLADLVAPVPDLRHLTEAILHQLRIAVEEMRAAGFHSLLTRVNELWGGPRAVELDLDGTIRRGTFARVDAEGRLILLEETGHFTAYDARQVRHLTETDLS